jgi:hypothetical protein
MTRNKRCCLLVLLAVGFYPRGARADLFISAPTLTARAGSSGNFEILLTNTGPGGPPGIGIGSFSFDISTANPDIRFTGASTMTSVVPSLCHPLTNGCYIYAGNSFSEINGFPLATKTGQELQASDAPNNGIASFIVPTLTVSLGEVFYSVTDSALTGPFSITFSNTGTSLSDQLGNSLAFTASNGEITVTTIPEPAHITLLAVCLGVFLVSGSRARAR